MILKTNEDRVIESGETLYKGAVISEMKLSSILGETVDRYIKSLNENDIRASQKMIDTLFCEIVNEKAIKSYAKKIKNKLGAEEKMIEIYKERGQFGFSTVMNLLVRAI